MTSLERRIDVLYGLPPEDFTAARDEMAGKLKAAGERDAEKEVRGLRKPTVAAWAINQLSRRHRQELDRLLAAGEKLREAQDAVAGGGKADEFRRRSAERSKLVERLVALAEAILREAGVSPDPHRARIEETLLAIGADEDAAARVAAGRLAKPVALGGEWSWLSTAPPPERPAKTRARDREVRERRVEAAKEEVRTARDAAREAEREVSRLRSELRRSERTAAQAADRLADAERALEDARR